MDRTKADAAPVLEGMRRVEAYLDIFRRAGWETDWEEGNGNVLYPPAGTLAERERETDPPTTDEERLFAIVVTGNIMGHRMSPRQAAYTLRRLDEWAPVALAVGFHAGREDARAAADYYRGQLVEEERAGWVAFAHLLGGHALLQADDDPRVTIDLSAHDAPVAFYDPHGYPERGFVAEPGFNPEVCP